MLTIKKNIVKKNSLTILHSVNQNEISLRMYNRKYVGVTSPVRSPLIHFYLIRHCRGVSEVHSV